MPLFGPAKKRLIAPGGNDPAIKVVGAILHVDAGNAVTLYDYFNGPSAGIESHFHIRKDGIVEQYRDTGREADANFKANSFVEDGVRRGYVSIETQGLEKGEWTPQQLRSIKDLLAWLAETHGFPLRKCRDPRDPGVGFHTLFGAPSAWTPVSKSCPGPDRKRQFEDVLVPWFKDSREKPEPKPEPKPTPKPEPKPAAKVVDLSKVVAAAKRDPRAKSGTFVAKADVDIVEDALVAEGLLAKGYADGHFGTKTIAAYAKWQRECGYEGDDADGYPGESSLKKLGKKHGFDVKD